MHNILKNLTTQKETRKKQNEYLNVLSKGFPPEFKDSVNNVVSIIPQTNTNNIDVAFSNQFITYDLNGFSITMPYRNYFLEPTCKEIENLNKIEKTILSCIYSRSYDGFVRAKHINILFSLGYPNWVIPYIFKVSDEYVIEILQLVYDQLSNVDTQQFKLFCQNNFSSFVLSYNRMISYWNEFYRFDCYRFKDYVGRKLFIECFGVKRKMNSSDKQIKYSNANSVYYNKTDS